MSGHHNGRGDYLPDFYKHYKTNLKTRRWLIVIILMLMVLFVDVLLFSSVWGKREQCIADCCYKEQGRLAPALQLRAAF